MRAGPPPPIPHPKSLSLSLGPSTWPPLPETQFNESFLRSVDIKSDARNGFSAAMNRGIDWPPPPPLHFKVTSVRDGLATFMLGETLCPVVNNNKDRRVSLRWRLFWDFYYLQWLGFSNTNCYLRIDPSGGCSAWAKGWFRDSNQSGWALFKWHFPRP